MTTTDPVEPSGTASTAVHIINHTHWDREWFLTHEYTTAWIPDLIDELVELAARNESFEYLFDGQTLVIEDLLTARPEYRERVERLIARGTLGIGPVYSQADWRTAGGQLHLRNLTYGIADATALGAVPTVAWLVDLFGHISQAPQLLSMVGVNAAYVWRGVPAMHPVFDWEAPDGSRILTVDLFGGYRNLYGITKTPDIAVRRLVAETRKLEPHYDGRPIPLFDGYDLDNEPEDPVLHYAADGTIPTDIEVHASSPRRYVDAVSTHGERPVVAGELLSGKYGSTFPGSLSTRTYLKVLHHDAEQAVLRRAELLSALAAALGRHHPSEWFEQTSRELLRNAVHDCICGVSIDQVHERMERSYRRIIREATSEIRGALGTVLADFRSGTYAVSTTALTSPGTQRVGDMLVRHSPVGVGVWPIDESLAVRQVDEQVERFVWSNAHFSAEIDRDGIHVDGRPIARILVRRDNGDSYSSEPGAVLGVCSASADPVIESRTEIDAVVRIDATFAGDGVMAHAAVRARFDDGPVVHLTVDLDSEGTDFRVDAEFDTGVRAPTALVAMPFDLVERPHTDTDLLPPEVDPALAAVLMGQREVVRVDEFPVHDFVALRDSGAARMALGRGIRSYTSDASGVLSLALRRSVEWIAREALTFRHGDAGPAMYVPGARCERTVRHELGFAVLDGSTATTDLFRVSEGFHQPPLIVEVGTDAHGSRTSWSVFTEDLPVSGVERAGEVTVIRVFNADGAPAPLRESWEQRSVLGEHLGRVDSVGPKAIVDLAVPIDAPTDAPSNSPPPEMTMHGLPEVRVGHNRSRPDDRIMAELEARRAQLADERADVEHRLAKASGDDRYRLTHRQLVIERERAELALSLELNRRLASSTDVVSIPDEIDDVIAALGRELNTLRVDRRIYDYVVQSL
ncbi:hypothetical protein [Ilumatobacter sp.]|uniref:glycoside hydrolase family 38 N-terminal domain-containing protein n=1 Tax=Ilumatobacter sp. TaxID=1967498 RepID=UPI003AF672FA